MPCKGPEQVPAGGGHMLAAGGNLTAGGEWTLGSAAKAKIGARPAPAAGAVQKQPSAVSGLNGHSDRLSQGSACERGSSESTSEYWQQEGTTPAAHLHACRWRAGPSWPGRRHGNGRCALYAVQGDFLPAGELAICLLLRARCGRALLACLHCRAPSLNPLKRDRRGLTTIERDR